MASYGQSTEDYNDVIRKAQEFYEDEGYEQSAQIYEEAFEIPTVEIDPNDRYNAACSHALANNVNKAFDHLFYLAENPSVKYYNYWHVATDLDLNSLHQDERWGRLMKVVKNNKNEHEGVQSSELVSILDEVLLTDQRGRKEYRRTLEEFGAGSPEVKDKAQQVLTTDSLNMITVGRILDEQGWPEPREIGRSGTNAIFLTIQHADLQTQLKYLPMVREAVKTEKLQGGALALLEDRVMLRQGKRQIYGSQIGRDPETGQQYVSPLIEPEKVNERREAVGLGPIEDYVKRYGITWDPEKHKARREKVETQKE